MIIHPDDLRDYRLDEIPFREFIHFLENASEITGYDLLDVDTPAYDRSALDHVFAYDEDDADDFPVETVGLRDVVPTQEDVDPQVILDILRGKRGDIDDPIFLVEFGGELYIRDGHHRAWLREAMGYSDIQAHIACE